MAVDGKIRVRMELTPRQAELLRVINGVYLDGGPAFECAQEWERDEVTPEAPYTGDEVLELHGVVKEALRLGNEGFWD